MNYNKTLTRGNFILILLVISIMLILAACGGAGNNANGDDSGGEADSGLAPAEAEDIVSNAPDANELYSGIADTTDGEVLYVTLCAKCHGLEGFGDGPSMGSLNLTGGMALTVLQDRSDEELLEIITFGKGIDMPAWGLILSLEQRESVLTYIRTLGQ
jgi:mono/diheme cytochrome c family protein